MNSLPSGFKAIVVGASGAIGGAFVNALSNTPDCSMVIGLSRQSDPTFDITFSRGGENKYSVPRSRVWDSPPKSLLLVHGVAGSGKSVVSRKMYQYLCGEFYDKRQREGITVVPIFCNLPALANPLTDLVGGTLRTAPYNLRDTQIAELLELARGEGQHRIEVVFVLDGYDELRPEFLWKNLFLTNNLDQYREAPHVPAAAGSEAEPASTVTRVEHFAFPKVCST